MGPKDERPLLAESSTSSIDGGGAAATTSADTNSTDNTKTNNDKQQRLYEQDGDEARQIAQYLPYFPFKGIPRFYDIGGFLYEPAVFRRIVDIFVHRYRDMAVDVIAG